MFVNARRELQLDELHARGFDRSRAAGNLAIIVSCSGCQALVINGIATHESGCVRAMHQCRGCNELIPAREIYCCTCDGREIYRAHHEDLC